VSFLESSFEDEIKKLLKHNKQKPKMNINPP
jgi:hypothetical protein